LKYYLDNKWRCILIILNLSIVQWWMNFIHLFIYFIQFINEFYPCKNDIHPKLGGGTTLLPIIYFVASCIYIKMTFSPRLPKLFPKIGTPLLIVSWFWKLLTFAKPNQIRHTSTLFYSLTKNLFNTIQFLEWCFEWVQAIILNFFVLTLANGHNLYNIWLFSKFKFTVL
jgi:hypothetical protein